jgi:subtilisin family serine protease
MLHSRHLLAGAVLLSLGAAACSDDSQPSAPDAVAGTPAMAAARASEPTNDFILILPEGVAPSSTLKRDVAAAGGTLLSVQPELGLAYANSSAPDFEAKAAKLKGVQHAVRDLMVQWTDPNTRFETVEAEASISFDANAIHGSTESFWNAQWNATAISAPDAWDAGYRGRGARVAVIDGGFHNVHIDLDANLDVARSRSFVPGFAYNQDVGTFWHGTHVAGIVAAEVNGLGTAGIAPEATIIGLKALHNGTGSFHSVIDAIYYAATPIAQDGAGAHIINMSLGAILPKQGNAGTIHLLTALSRATSWARKQGVLVIAASGNDALDLDHIYNYVSVPAEAVGVVNVSALGPMGFYVAGNNTSVDRPASYSNFGQSSISLGAPGGDIALPGNAVCSVPRIPTGTLAQFCWAMDMVLSTSRGATPGAVSSYAWAAGTSMASPAVAGVAALIVGKYGPMDPVQLEAKLKSSSDDLGKPGRDDFYGHGRVNAYRAVTE